MFDWQAKLKAPQTTKAAPKTETKKEAPQKTKPAPQIGSYFGSYKATYFHNFCGFSAYGPEGNALEPYRAQDFGMTFQNSPMGPIMGPHEVGPWGPAGF